MKTYLSSILVLIIIFFSNCSPHQSDTTPMIGVNKEFANKWDSVSIFITKKIDKNKYDSLNLYNLDFVPQYNSSDFVLDFLLNNDSISQKLIDLTIINSGEILEYLISYQDNQMVDSLLVYYEDNVEYFQQIYSTLKNDSIRRVIITNNDFNDFISNRDTLVEKFIITPTLHFEKLNFNK